MLAGNTMLANYRQQYTFRLHLTLIYNRHIIQLTYLFKSTLEALNSEYGDLGETPVAASTTKTILQYTHCGFLA